MLILTRCVGETIVIGTDIRVTVIEARGGQVRIGIAAPKHVNVVREELLGRSSAEHGQPAEERD